MAGIHPDNLNIVIEGTRLCFLDNSAYQRERKRCFVSSTPNFDHRIGWLARCVRIFEGDYANKGTKEPLDRAQAVAGFVLDRILIHDIFPSGDAHAVRSEERRVGHECVRTCKSRWSPYH